MELTTGKRSPESDPELSPGEYLDPDPDLTKRDLLSSTVPQSLGTLTEREREMYSCEYADVMRSQRNPERAAYWAAHVVMRHREMLATPELVYPSTMPSRTGRPRPLAEEYLQIRARAERGARSVLNTELGQDWADKVGRRGLQHVTTAILAASYSQADTAKILDTVQPIVSRRTRTLKAEYPALWEAAQARSCVESEAA